MSEPASTAASRHATVHDLRVAEVSPLTEDSVAITFAVPDGLREAYAFTAGQHLTILCDDGVRRSFSLCTAPSSGTLRIGVKRLPGGAFSDHVVGRLAPGDVLPVMTPAGRFVAVPDPVRRASYVAVAAGSGITPVLSVVTTLLEEEPGSDVSLVYANRTSASVMFLDEVHDLKDRFPARFQLVHVLSREQRESALLSGRLDAERLEALLRAHVRVEDVDEWFLCGPQQMVLELRGHLRTLGAGVVHTELFHADPPPRPQRPRAVEGGGAAEITVRLDGRSTDLLLPAEGPSVLEAAAAVRADVPFACKGGVCGTCRARVLEGAVEMEVNYALEPDELARGYVLTCQSHPTTRRVVLDYDA